jgi:hypothetical protein
MERHKLNQNIWTLSFLALFTVVALSITYLYYMEIPHQQDIANIKAMERVNCWRHDERSNLIFCLRNVPRCGQGWSLGTPPSPLRCSF